eukprot:CAMPEP_0171367744 /NCGR_PEP_ID=MMETSP0879-20121228/6288_1 /TAXON_ID=67004 /ORGANISM="Thalassiosira weissflogii, Strain CCMP1336" /LENGTH=53 /DNA_ID=CAMNT_0011875839 /DNA_START=109 /DNA_END=270 /DNA_ORIENTATION=-
MISIANEQTMSHQAMLNTEPSISHNQNKEPRIYCFNQQITDANVPNAFTAPTE